MNNLSSRVDALDHSNARHQDAPISAPPAEPDTSSSEEGDSQYEQGVDQQGPPADQASFERQVLSDMRFVRKYVPSDACPLPPATPSLQSSHHYLFGVQAPAPPADPILSSRALEGLPHPRLSPNVVHS